MKKRAEMTTQQIVILVVLIASFAVILLFFSKLNFGSESQKEVCHNSVVMRAKTPGEMVPLNCQREYVCISMKNSCDKMTNAKVYKVKTEDEVYEVLANELADCWWMFGEGKINYVGKDKFSELYCSLCSQIAFDNSTREIFGGETFEKIRLHDYMANENRTRGESYSEYIYGTNDLEEISRGISFGEINLSQNYYAMMGIASSTSTWTWVGIGALAVVAGAVSAGTGSIAVLAIAAGSGAIAGGTVIAPVAKMSEEGEKYIKPWLIEANSDEYNSLGCKSITTLS